MGRDDGTKDGCVQTLLGCVTVASPSEYWPFQPPDPPTLFPAFTGFFFFLDHTACGTLVSQPGIEPKAPALEVRSLNHTTTRKSLGCC